MTLKYDHLLGISFVHGSDDCYGLIRRFYKDNFDLNLTNYARPDNWWNLSQDLYMENFYAEGFRPIDCHPRDWRPGDAFLMAIGARVACHAAINLGDGNILHHFIGRMSEKIPYAGAWRNKTVAVLRHKDIRIEDVAPKQVDLMDLLPPHKRRQLELSNATP
jgi:cell wall-associated NlpC family hydrolase